MPLSEPLHFGFDSQKLIVVLLILESSLFDSTESVHGYVLPKKEDHLQPKLALNRAFLADADLCSFCFCSPTRL